MANARGRKPAGRTRRDYDSRQRRNPKNEIRRKVIIQEPEDDDRFYVIEKLIDKRIDDNGNEEYLVRWLNYSSDHDSWEPRQELENNAKDLICEYNRLSNDEDEPEKLHCICQRPYRFEQGGMIQCFYCLSWYHFNCIHMNMEEANSFARYYCNDCRKSNPRLKNVIKQTKLATFYNWMTFSQDS